MDDRILIYGWTIALNLFKAWIAMIYVQLLTKILTSARYMASKGNFHHQPTTLSYETRKEPHWWKLVVHVIAPGRFYLYSHHAHHRCYGWMLCSEWDCPVYRFSHYCLNSQVSSDWNWIGLAFCLIWNGTTTGNWNGSKLLVKRGGRNEAAQAYLHHRVPKHPKITQMDTRERFHQDNHYLCFIKGLVYPKMKMLLSFVNLCDFISSMDTKYDI